MGKSILSIIALLLLLSKAGAQQADQVITFPQGTYLEWCVRQNMQMPYLKPIYSSDALGLTALICDEPRITSLEGIQNFPNLTYIDLGSQGTQIKDLTPLSSLVNLRRLRIGNSNITDITPLAGLSSLYYLDLSNNHVNDLKPLAGLVYITNLIMSNQGPDYIKDLTPLDNLTRIQVLDLQSNKISDISPLHRMHSLQYLHLKDNRIVTIKPLDNLTSLQQVNFTINLITDLTPLIPSTKLNSLYANNNRVASLEFLEQLNSITHLSLNQNRIVSIDHAASLLNPVMLSFDMNGIDNITALKTHMYYRNIKELGIAYNCIKDLDKMPLYTIPTVRKDHQCEPIPLPDEYSLATIVNGDILKSSVTGEPVDEDLINKLDGPKGPGGCAIGDSSAWPDIILLLAVAALYIVNRKRANERNYYNEN